MPYLHIPTMIVVEIERDSADVADEAINLLAQEMDKLGDFAGVVNFKFMPRERVIGIKDTPEIE